MKEPRTTRRIEPVAVEPAEDEIFDPRRSARPLAALLLAAGPLLALLGLAGWLRLLWGVRGPLEPGWDPLILAWDGALLTAFVVPHSLLARGLGRRWLNQPLGPAGERPLYVLYTGLSLALLAWGWRTSGPMIWNHEGLLAILARLLQAGGLLLAGWGTVALGIGNVFGLAGLRALRRGHQPAAGEFTALPPYRYVRHPIDLGNLLLLLGMPEVSLDRLGMLLVFGVWLLISANWAERDAEISFGDAYRAYKERTPRWIPRWRERAR